MIALSFVIWTGVVAGEGVGASATMPGRFWASQVVAACVAWPAPTVIVFASL